MSEFGHEPLRRHEEMGKLRPQASDVMASSISRIFGILLLITTTTSARADFTEGKMPDGIYHCEVYLLGLFLNLGDITIKGSVYSGPVTFGPPQQGYNYQMDANGVINFAVVYVVRKKVLPEDVPALFPALLDFLNGSTSLRIETLPKLLLMRCNLTSIFFIFR